MVRDGSTCAGESSGIRVVSHQKTDESGGVGVSCTKKMEDVCMLGKSET